MARYFRVSPKFWTDLKVRSWSDDGRMLALYELTCRHRTTEGLFRLPPEYVRVDLGWSQKRYEKSRAELVSSNFIAVEGDIVLIRKALKYQAPQNPNQVIAAINALEEVPPSKLDGMFQQLAERFCERLAKALPQQLPERFGKPHTQALTHTPAPSSVVADVETELKCQEIRGYFLSKGYELEDIDVVVERYALRSKGIGEPVSDVDRWGAAILDKMAAARSQNGQGPKSMDIDGVPHRYDDDLKQWVEVTAA